MTDELKATGIMSGIGTMLAASRKAGFRITGNVEWRSNYRMRDKENRNTFEEYFGVPIGKDLDVMPPEVVEDMKDADLVMLHNECGNYSVMSAQHKPVNEVKEGDFPWVFERLHILGGKVFVLDNLAPSLKAVPPDRWISEFPDYRVYPIPVSNAHYGNSQINRKRTFFIGVHRDLDFIPYGSEGDDSTVPCLADVIGDLQDQYDTGIPNHESHSLEGIAGGFRPYDLERSLRGDRLTWREVREYFERVPEGEIYRYFNKDGEWKSKIGLNKGKKNGYAYVLAGSLGGGINPWTNLPYSVRERMRINGIPDDMTFYGTVYEADGWNVSKNQNLVRQASKGMPHQWCYYISEQIARYLCGEKPIEFSGRYNYQPELVSRAKQRFCALGHYDGLHPKLCETCWLQESCDIQTLKRDFHKVEDWNLGEPKPVTVIDLEEEQLELGVGNG